eukprot:7393475-Pyramimonas_sp.AAC.1
MARMRAPAFSYIVKLTIIKTLSSHLYHSRENSILPPTLYWRQLRPCRALVPALPAHAPGYPIHMPGYPIHMPGYPSHVTGYPVNMPGYPVPRAHTAAE